MGEVRIQKYIAESGLASRRAAERLIGEGRVTLNGEVVKAFGIKVNPEEDFVQVDGVAVATPEKGLVLFHKPRSVVSTRSDPGGRPTVMDYLPRGFDSYYPVGRLDYHSTGLMLLTNDGELADRLLHPRFELERVYDVRVAGHPSENLIKRISKSGIVLEDGRVFADLTLLEQDKKSSWLRITVKEGRNRLVRRLFERVNHPVLKLKRIQHGPVKLGTLAPGEIEFLTTSAYKRLRAEILEATDSPLQVNS